MQENWSSCRDKTGVKIDQEFLEKSLCCLYVDSHSLQIDRGGRCNRSVNFKREIFSSNYSKKSINEQNFCTKCFLQILWCFLKKWSHKIYLLKLTITFFTETTPYFEFVESCLRHKSEMVIYEAANAIVNLKRTTSRELIPAISVLQLFCSSPKATMRFAAVRTLNQVSFNRNKHTSIPDHWVAYFLKQYPHLNTFLS